jgi:hypothetical protein
MQPFTYIFIPGKNLLHSTTGIMKTKPIKSPQRILKSTKKAPISVTKDDAKTQPEKQKLAVISINSG